MLLLTEMFGHFIFAPELSYEELMDKERLLIQAVDAILQNAGTEHIQFESLGDAMRVQCAFAEHDDALFHSLCRQIAQHVYRDVEARLLFVDKNLHVLNLYTICNGNWKEALFALPYAGEIGKHMFLHEEQDE